MFYGILDHIEEDRLGSSLTVAATVGATSITVDWTVDFGDEGTLTLAGQSYDYDTVNSDLSTIGLVAGETITVAAAVGEEVGVVTSVDEESAVWKAYVLLPDADQAQPVVVPLETRRFYALGDGQQGTMVPIDVVGDGDMVIAGAPGEAADASHDYDFPDPAEVAIDPPAESPTIISVTGSATALTVFTEPILPTTLLDFYINGVLVAADQRTTVLNLTTDGTAALVADTDYTVTVQAHNAATDADPTLLPAASAGVTARLVPGMTATAIYALLAAGFIIANTVQVGSSMTLDGVGGFTITHPDGRQTYMRADGSGNQFVGQAVLDAATIMGALTLLGQNNFLNGLLTLGTGVSDPTGKPGVTAAGWDSISPGSGNIYGYVPSGLASDGTNWIYTDSYGYFGNVNWINKTTGARTVLTTLPTNFNGVGGITKVGSSYYVLGQDGARSGNWYVYIFTSSWVKTGEWRLKDAGGVDIPSNHSCAIGLDGAGALLIARRSSSTAFTINVYSLSGAASAAAGTYQTWAGATITGVWKAAVDTATVRYVVSSAADGIRVFNTSTAARVPAEEWTPAAGPLGLGYDGSNWWTLDLAKVWKYTNLIGTYDFAFTWVDDDAGGAGTAETKKSTLRTLPPTKRAKWTVSLPSAPPDDGTTDGANTASLYAAATGNTLVRQTALPEGTLSATYSTLATSGTAPPSTNGFAARSGALGRIASAAVVVATGDPMTDFRGDGSYRLAGPNLDDVALTALTPAAGFAFTGGTLGYQVKNGQVYVIANFTATTGTPFTATTEVTIVAAGGIPASLRPAVPAGGGARFTGGGSGAGAISVLSDGSVAVINNSVGNRSSLRATVCYPKP